MKEEINVLKKKTKWKIIIESGRYPSEILAQYSELRGAATETARLWCGTESHYHGIKVGQSPMNGPAFSLVSSQNLAAMTFRDVIYLDRTNIFTPEPPPASDDNLLQNIGDEFKFILLVFHYLENIFISFISN